MEAWNVKIVIVKIKIIKFNKFFYLLNIIFILFISFFLIIIIFNFIFNIKIFYKEIFFLGFEDNYNIYINLFYISNILPILPRIRIRDKKR